MAAICGQVAQLVEQRTENPRVGGSIPSLATTHPLQKQSVNPEFLELEIVVESSDIRFSRLSYVPMSIWHQPRAMHLRAGGFMTKMAEAFLT